MSLSLAHIIFVCVLGVISQSLNDAVRSVFDADIVPVVAAGNQNDDACHYSPSNVSFAITVGASDINDNGASFSNFGSCLDIFGPG